MSERSLTQKNAAPALYSDHSGQLQRQCVCGQHTNAGECKECKKKREGSLQRSTSLSKRGDQCKGETVLPVVQEILHSPGEPLDAATRGSFEPRFNRDFSQVRVHTDPHATASARAIKAQAYTVGRDIAFGPGRFELSTTEGQELLTHELAHVVYQWHSQVPLLQRAPLLYETTGFTISPPSKPFTLKDAQDLVDAKKSTTPSELTGASIKGATPGSDAEIFLWYTIFQVADRTRWGSEMDLVVPIGWPPIAGGPAPVGTVTVSISDKGNAVAKLLSAGEPPVPTTFATVADAETHLKIDYGIAGFMNDDASWTAEEANQVANAFALLPAADRAALKGAVLLRVATIDGGKTAGEFVSHQAVSNTTVTNEAKLKLANNAFPATSASFVGSAAGASPSSYMTIVHEVGHAVASRAKREATLAHLEAMAKTNELVEPLNLAVAARNTATDQYNALVSEYNELIKKYNAALPSKDATRIADAKKVVNDKKKEVDAKGAEVATLKKDEDVKRAALSAVETEAKSKRRLAEATRISATSLAPFKTAAATAKRNASAALTKAQDATAKYDPKVAPDSAAYRKAVEDTATAISDYATAAAQPDVKLDPLELTVQTTLDNCTIKRDSLKTTSSGDPALTDFAAADKAQNSWLEAERAYARAKQRTARVQKFVDFVTSSKIAPFTPYAKESWPLKPEEFFADAYSLYRSDPEYLKTNFKALFDWFAAGKYK